MSESLNDKVVGPVPGDQARDGALAGWHSCMNCRFNLNGECSRYGYACSSSHHCVSLDMTEAMVAELLAHKRAAEAREAQQREKLKAERGRDALAKKCALRVAYRHYLFTVPTCFLELVTPVEDLEPYNVVDAHTHWDVADKDMKTVATYSKGNHPHAKAAAEAECKRLNEEWRKDQNK